jgi:hypothetical protein
MDETFGSLLEKNVNLEAALAKQAPLIEAANKWDGRVTDWASIKPLIQAVDDYRAALALREEKGK